MYLARAMAFMLCLVIFVFPPSSLAQTNTDWGGPRAPSVSPGEIEDMMNRHDQFRDLLNSPDPRRAEASLRILLRSKEPSQVRMAVEFALPGARTAAILLLKLMQDSGSLIFTIDPLNQLSQSNRVLIESLYGGEISITRNLVASDEFCLLPNSGGPKCSTEDGLFFDDDVFKLNYKSLSGNLTPEGRTLVGRLTEAQSGISFAVELNVADALLSYGSKDGLAIASIATDQGEADPSEVAGFLIGRPIVAADSEFVQFDFRTISEIGEEVKRIGVYSRPDQSQTSPRSILLQISNNGVDWRIVGSFRMKPDGKLDVSFAPRWAKFARVVASDGWGSGGLRIDSVSLD